MNDTTSHSTAVLLIAHGSRRSAANAELVDVAEQVRATGRFPIVEIAYLELAEPTIPAGMQKCLEQSPQRVLLMPYFLSPGVHVVNDLEEYRERFAQESPAVEFQICDPLGLALR